MFYQIRQMAEPGTKSAGSDCTLLVGCNFISHLLFSNCSDLHIYNAALCAMSFQAQPMTCRNNDLNYLHSSILSSSVLVSY